MKRSLARLFHAQSTNINLMIHIHSGLVKPGAYPASQHKVFFGPNEILLPIYSSIAKAVAAQPQATVFINYASYRYDIGIEEAAKGRNCGFLLLMAFPSFWPDLSAMHWH